MCEFRVKVTGLSGERQVADEIVYVKVGGDGVVLRDILASAVQVYSAIVSYVSVTSEEIHLVEHPLVGAFLTLLSKLEKSKNKEDVKAAWESFVKEGDKIISEC